MVTKMQIHLQKAKEGINGHSLGYKAKVAMGMIICFLDQTNHNKEEEDCINTTKITLQEFQAFITNMIDPKEI